MPRAPLLYLSVRVSVYLCVRLCICQCVFICLCFVRLSLCLSVALADSVLKKQDVKIKFRPTFIALWTYLINTRDDRIFNKSISSYIPDMEILGADRFI